jgi:hydrogenase maturation factor
MMSKFSLDVLQRCVFPFTTTDDPDVILGAAFGEDVALIRVSGDILVSHLDPIVGAIDNIGWLAVHVACNDIATTGIPPRWILPLVLVPRQDDEDLLERIMHDVTRGGLLETLLELASLSKVSIEVDASLLPIPPIVSRFAKAFQFDPLWMISSGTLAATVPTGRVAEVSRVLKKTGMPFAFVGKVMEGSGVHVRCSGEIVHYRDIRCEEDELARMWRLYPREG